MLRRRKPRTLRYRPVEMWWHKRRNQISSFGETDESIWIGRGASVQSTTGSRGVRISDSNAGYTMFRGSVKGIGYPLNSPVSPSLPLPYVTVCHHISNAVYKTRCWRLDGKTLRIPFCGFICHSEPSIHYFTLTHETPLRGISKSSCAERVGRRWKAMVLLPRDSRDWQRSMLQ